MSPFEILEIVVLVFYATGLPLALWVCKRQGWGRDAGWFFLLVMPLVRITGASLRIAAEEKPGTDTGLLIGSTVLNSLGLIPLLFALMGLVERV